MKRVVFDSRVHAGKLLGEKLKNSGYVSTTDNPVVALALPRGGLPIAKEVCEILNCPLDVIVAKKIGFPGHEEYAIGAVTARGERIVDQRVVERYSGYITQNYLDEKTRTISAQSQEREKQFREGHPMIDLRDKTVLIVDDGIATGMTMKAAIQDVKVLEPRKLVVAVPILAKHTLNKLLDRDDVDDIVYIDAPDDFRAVGRFYKDFSETTDEEAFKIMQMFHRQHSSSFQTSSA